jgi:hypothetical protein
MAVEHGIPRQFLQGTGLDALLTDTVLFQVLEAGMAVAGFET